MKSLIAHLSYGAAIVLVAASAASAQSEPPQHLWSHGTTLAVLGGVATASDDTGGGLGASVGWEITPRIGIEGTGLWIDREPGASAFNASMNVHAVLTRSQPVTPFVEGGFGMYLAMFDANRAATIPAFYANRMTGIGTNTFTDPAFFASAGIEILRTNHVTFRPAVGAMFVVDSGRSYTVTTFTVQVSYHFEDHPRRP